MICRNCFKEIDDKAAYCPFCGEKQGMREPAMLAEIPALKELPSEFSVSSCFIGAPTQVKQQRSEVLHGSTALCEAESLITSQMQQAPVDYSPPQVPPVEQRQTFNTDTRAMSRRRFFTVVAILVLMQMLWLFVLSLRN